METQCIIIILALTNQIVQTNHPQNSPDLPTTEVLVRNIQNRFSRPFQNLLEVIVNYIKQMIQTKPKPPPTSCLCGRAKPASRIVNGENAEKNEFPWQVGLKTGKRDFTLEKQILRNIV